MKIELIASVLSISESDDNGTERQMTDINTDEEGAERIPFLSMKNWDASTNIMLAESMSVCREILN